MTQLMVSVTSAAEARLAAENGADMIDVKDPAQGSLGAASPDVWRQVIAAVGKQVRVSAALGELRDSRAQDLAKQTKGLWFAKIGMQNCTPGFDWEFAYMDWRAKLPIRPFPVMTVYADWRECGAPPPHELLKMVKSIRIPAVLVDTCIKNGDSLLDHCTEEQLVKFTQAVRKLKSMVVFAGSLKFADLPILLPLAPDFVAVRGAVCQGSRTGPLDGALVRKWATAISIVRK